MRSGTASGKIAAPGCGMIAVTSKLIMSRIANMVAFGMLVSQRLIFGIHIAPIVILREG
jgi:hypothetical protein